MQQVQQEVLHVAPLDPRKAKHITPRTLTEHETTCLGVQRVRVQQAERWVRRAAPPHPRKAKHITPRTTAWYETSRIGVQRVQHFLIFSPARRRGKSKEPLHPLHPRPSQTLTDAHHLRYCYPMATRWSEDDKANALDQLRNGDTLAQTHHDTGIPKPTLIRWAKADGITVERSSENTREATEAKREQWAELRATVANQAGGTAQRILALVTDALDSGDLEVRTIGQAKDAALTMAILVDKAQVLGGEASTITAHVGLREQVAEQAAELAPRLRAVV